jgi:hypothetical protein
VSRLTSSLRERKRWPCLKADPRACARLTAPACPAQHRAGCTPDALPSSEGTGPPPQDRGGQGSWNPSLPSRSARIDGHMTPAGGREWFLGPPRPAVAKPEAGQLCHEVQLVWPRIPDLHGEEADALCREHYMLRHDARLHGIVHGSFEMVAIRLHLVGSDPMAPVKPREIRDKRFEHKDAIRWEMLREKIPSTRRVFYPVPRH